MERSRVVNVAEGPWGRSVIYSPDAEEKHMEEEPERPIVIIMDGKRKEVSTITLTRPTHEPERIEDDINIYRLPYFEASLFATILEDTITELRILVECNTEMRISKLQSDMGLLMALKYGVQQPTVTDELDGIDPKRLGCEEYKLNKLDADRKYLSDILLTSYTDLSLNKSYKTLAMHVQKIVDRDNYRAELQELEARNRIIRREMNKQLRQQRNHIKSVTYDTDAIIDDLRTQVEDSSLNAEICGRYVDNWERARTEQHIQTIHDKEQGPSEIVEYYKQRTDHEQRVHTEVELVVNIAINETLEKVEEWMNKYDKDMEKIDLTIQIKKNDYQNMRDIRIGLEETIAKHAQIMKEWVDFKEAREKARLYREKMTKCAIMVQAWWRGLLVRRQLGPYKPVKKPPAKKKK